MFNKPKNKYQSIIILSMILVGLTSTFFLFPELKRWTEKRKYNDIKLLFQQDLKKESIVLTLAEVPAKQRKDTLERIASQKKPSIERARARYLLSVDLLTQYEGGLALRQLKHLEHEYPILMPYILLKRARGYELTNNLTQAKDIWRILIKKYPASFVSAEAYYQLGKYESKYWDIGIIKFPQHPKIQELIYKRLEEDPKQFELLISLARHAIYDKKANNVRNYLVNNYTEQLLPQDWETIGNGYWETQEYDKAYFAYLKAKKSPHNLYRLARGQELEFNQKKQKKIFETYKKILVNFPDSSEALLSLKRLIILSPPEIALNYLDQVIQKSDVDIPESLLHKAKLLQKLNRTNEADKIYKLLIFKYPHHKLTASYRWQIVKKAVNKKDFLKAKEWAKSIFIDNTDSPIAPKAGFWLGKWEKKLGNFQESRLVFQNVIKNHPQSYYAWRSAIQLGWNVGDFNNLRQIFPLINQPTLRPTPPAGSEIFKTLYRLGQDNDALLLFKAETNKNYDFSVKQGFTDALLKLTHGKNLQSINQIWNLQNKNNFSEKQEWKNLRKEDQYWRALFPLPFYQSITNWAKHYKLNPLLIMSVMRQESRFENSSESPVGATGIMQVMPITGEWISNQMNIKHYHLNDLNDNIFLGVWYLDYTHKKYNNNSLLAVASYNAGPNNVSNWIKQYKTQDPDLFVEEIPFKETKNYVKSVFSNYWNYLRIYDQETYLRLKQHK